MTEICVLVTCASPEHRGGFCEGHWQTFVVEGEA